MTPPTAAWPRRITWGAALGVLVLLATACPGPTPPPARPPQAPPGPEPEPIVDPVAPEPKTTPRPASPR